MKKTLWIASVALIVGVAAAAVFERSGRPAPANGEVSERVAQQLQQKIDAVKKAKNTAAEHRLQTVEVTEAELESYVLYRLRDDIPHESIRSTCNSLRALSRPTRN